MARPITRAVVPLLTGSDPMDSGTNPHLVRGVAIAKNVRFPMRGLAEKRYGLTTVGTAQTSAAWIATLEDNPVAISASNVYALRGAAFASIANAEFVTAEILHRERAAGATGVIDLISVTDFWIVAYQIYERSATTPIAYVRTVVIRKSDGSIVSTLDSATRSAAPWPRPRLLDLGAAGVRCITSDGTGFASSLINKTTGAQAAYAALSITGVLGTPFSWDADSDPTTGRFALIYYDPTAGDVWVDAYDSAATLINYLSVDSMLASSAIDGVAIAHGDDTEFFCCWSSDDSLGDKSILYANRVDVGPAAVVQDGSVAAVADSRTPGNNAISSIVIRPVQIASVRSACVILFDWEDDDGGHGIYSCEYLVTAGVGSALVSADFDAPLVKHCRLLSRPDETSLDFWAATHCEDAQGTAILFDQAGLAKAKLYVDRLTPTATTLWGVGAPKCRYTSGLSATPRKLALLGGAQDWEGALSSIDIVSISAPSLITSSEIDGALFLGGAMPMEMDGRELHEQGFLHYPDWCSVSGTGAGATMAAGYYRYIAMYERVDASGKVHVSSPTSTPCELNNSSAGYDYADVLVPCPAGRAGDDFAVAVYRTKVSAVANAPGPFYRLGYIAASGLTVLFRDRYTDSEIGDEAIAYTDGGAIENIQPPPYLAQCRWESRHFVGAALEDGIVRYSKLVDIGQPTEHSDYLELRLPEDSPVTALSRLGPQRLAVFFSRATYVVSGTPLDNLASGPGLTASLVSSSVGCPSQSTIVETPLGVMFFDGSIVQMLSSDGRIAPVGGPVRAYSEAATVYGSARWAAESLALWALGSNILAFDWAVGAWSVWPSTNVGGLANGSDTVYRISTPAGVVSKLDRTSYLDASTAYAMAIATGWLSIPGEASRQRVSRILIRGYTAQTTGNVKIRLAYDDEPEWTEVQTFALDACIAITPDASIAMGSTVGTSYTDKAMMIDIAPSRTRCSSVKIEISDDSEGGTSTRIGITSISAEIVSRSDRARPGDARGDAT